MLYSQIFSNYGLSFIVAECRNTEEMLAALQKVNEIDKLNNVVACSMDELVRKGQGRETNTWMKAGTGNFSENVMLLDMVCQ